MINNACSCVILQCLLVRPWQDDGDQIGMDTEIMQKSTWRKTDTRLHFEDVMFVNSRKAIYVNFTTIVFEVNCLEDWRDVRIK